MRLRTTVGAMSVVGLALALGGVLLLHLLSGSLTDGATRSATVRAEELTALLGREITPGDLPLDGDADSFVQILDHEGSVVASSAGVAGRPSLTTAARARLDPGPLGDGEPFVAVTRHTRDGRWTVVSGRSLEPVSDGTETVTAALLVGVPSLGILAAVTAWVLTGRALRPVEAVRQEVAAISARELDRRVPVPPGDDEVTRLAVTMNAMLERLEKARSTQQRFVADASHELRTPLAAMRSQLEVALARPEATTVAELGRDLLDQDLLLGQLVEDLLLLARSDEGLVPVPHRPVDLDDLVFEAADQVRRDGALDVDASGVGAARVRGDAGALTRLVRNLVDNAQRHARTTIRLRLVATDGCARLEVHDDGDGIAEADRERVFERFTRLDAARSRDRGGSGLGLAIVREVARAHGGTAHVGQGTGGCFVVQLPLAD